MYLKLSREAIEWLLRNANTNSIKIRLKVRDHEKLRERVAARLNVDKDNVKIFEEFEVWKGLVFLPNKKYPLTDVDGFILLWEFIKT